MSAEDPEKLFFAAHAARTAGDLAEAERLLRLVADLQPKSATVQTALAEVLLARGRASHAIEAAGRAVTLDGNLAPAHVALGEAAGQLGNSRAALKHHRAAHRLMPSSVAASVALVRTLKALGMAGEASAVLTEACAAMAGDAASLNNLGTAALDLLFPEQARALFEGAIAARPDDPGIYINLARACSRSADDDAARETLRRAREIAPGDPRITRADGIIAVNAGRPAEALVSLENYLAEVPSDADAKLARGLARLVLGDWKNGWADYEARLDASRGPGRRRFAKPRWSPEMTTGRVLLHAEQGMGDTLQFVRYAQTLTAAGLHTVLQVQAPLVDLLRTAKGVGEVLGPGDALPPFDAEAPLPSLPGILGATPALPAVDIPYLAAPPGDLPDLPVGDGPLVGLVWRGNPAFINDRRRSPGLAALAPILATPGVRFVGLQLDAAAEIAGADPDRRISDMSGLLTDFAVTARVLEALDLVITSDTAMAHLAGALGRPGWLMLSSAPDFRWGREGDRTDWYPSLTLFRQRISGDWSGPVGDMAGRLASLAG